ncbi:MAG: hypothetical protein P8X95_18685 [Anaerolineales bacterium]|jgi:hypothetical protein
MNFSNKRTQTTLLILVVSIGFVLTWLLQYPVVQCYLVAWSNLDAIAPKVFVDPEMPKADRENLLANISDAMDRIAGLFGEHQSTPVIIAGHSMDVMKRYGGNTYNRVGRTYLTALGAYIVLGPDGISNLDILAHEMGHAELAFRVGYKKANQFPDWLEEGIVLQLDHRFTEGDWQAKTSNRNYAPGLDELGVIKHDDWNGYATAKHEVARWLGIVGQEGFWEFLQGVRDGENAHVLYKSLEKSE